MSLTVDHALTSFPGWQITDMAGGWIAIRSNLVPKNSGLFNVRCGVTLEELTANLHAEMRLQKPGTPAVRK